MTARRAGRSSSLHATLGFPISYPRQAGSSAHTGLVRRARCRGSGGVFLDRGGDSFARNE